MDKLSLFKSSAGAVCLLAACLSIAPLEAEAGTKKKKAVRTPAVFDIATRKSTKKSWGPHVKGTSYAQVKLTHRENLKRDDDVDDATQRMQVYLGGAARVDFGAGVVGFAHAELTYKHTDATGKASLAETDFIVKEAHVSLPLSQGVQLTLGRMRFRDADKWIADSAVDGVHLALRWGQRDALQGLDLGVVKRVEDEDASFALAHLWQMTPAAKMGGFAILETGETGERAHLAGYREAKITQTLSYYLQAGAVLGDLPHERNAGFGFDLRATKALSGARKPQVTFGIAAGSSGFQQSGLQSNKTYDGGQTQVHRYGEVYRPDLTNLAVATLAYGLRPSKAFSLTVTAHAYARVSVSGPEPVARFAGDLSPAGRFLGAELDIAGAWRPNKSSKIEFGAGLFQPRNAYQDRSSSTRLFARYTVTF